MFKNFRNILNRRKVFLRRHSAHNICTYRFAKSLPKTPNKLQMYSSSKGLIISHTKSNARKKRGKTYSRLKNRCPRLLLLRSESPSGKCAKRRTVVASNNKDHPTRSLYYCLFVPHIYIYIYMGVILRAHPVCGESHIQRNASGEAATLSINVRINVTFRLGANMKALHKIWTCSKPQIDQVQCFKRKK